jgi:hypothetical protein
MSQGLVLGFGVTRAPVHREADDQAAEHAQDPQGVGVADPAAVIIEGHTQALMGAVFTGAGLPVGLEPPPSPPNALLTIKVGV